MRYLFLLRQSPYATPLAREALDMALAFAAFDQHIQLVFLGDGVYQLVKGQDTQNLGIKNIGKTLDALAMYDINDVYVCQTSLAGRGLNPQDLSIDAKEISAADIAKLIEHADKVVNL